MELYHRAIADALVIEESELLPLVTLRPSDPLVRYDATGTKVLLLNVHAHPESFPPQARMLTLFNMWTFTDKEFLAWLRRRGVHYHGHNWSQRLNQLLGMLATRGSTHVTGLWVKPHYVIRPAYSFDVFSPVATDSFSAALELYRAHWAQRAHAEPPEPAEPPDAPLEPMEVELPWAEVLRRARAQGARYRHWFDHQVLIAYGTSEGYPWTRIGYTYDWGNARQGDSRSKYGVSEFMIPAGTMVEVAFTLALDAFIAAARRSMAAPDALPDYCR